MINIIKRLFKKRAKSRLVAGWNNPQPHAASKPRVRRKSGQFARRIPVNFMSEEIGKFYL